MQRAYTLVLILAWLGLGDARAVPLAPEKVPGPLRPWIPWVLHGAEERSCPFVYDRHEARRCSWPTRLEIEVQEGGAAFRQAWDLYKDAWVALPGDPEHWPEEVRLDGRKAVVLARNGRPEIWLPAGRHRITGGLHWAQPPDSLAVAPDTALVELRVGDHALPYPTLRADGQLWLADPQAVREATPRHLVVQVFRRLIDELPMELITRLEIDVSGLAREESLEGSLLPGFIPLRLESPLPARLEPDGRLRVQLRPGRWTIDLIARAPGDTTKLMLLPEPEPWPNVEVWSFEPRNHLRLVEIEGVPPVDPRQTKLPVEWHQFPAFRLAAGDSMSLKVIRRGDPEPAPDRLELDRHLWLDMDGRGYTVQDHMRGNVTRAWRLEAGPGLMLGRVAIDGVPQLITLREGSDRPGVEVRRGDLTLVADSRYEGDAELPAAGWGHDLHALRATLHLPPGWRLFAAGGSDDVAQSWLQRWSLLDLFLVLVATLAIAQLRGRAPAGLGLVTLVLLWHEPGAPALIWLHLIAATALLGVLPEGWFKRLIQGYRYLTLGILALLALPFAVEQVRLGLYPQLERPRAVSPGEQRAKHAALEAKSAPPPEFERLGKQAAEEALPSTEVPERLATSPAAAPAEPPSAPPAMALEEIDPKARVQTGPGVPEWRWTDVDLRWRGPVERHQTLRLLLFSPGINLLLNLARVTLMIGLAVLLARPPGTSAWLRAAPGVAGAVLVGLLSPQPEARADFPDPDILKELRERLLEAPTCLPNCAQIPRMNLEATPSGLRLRLRVHAAEAVAIPLPGQAEHWLPHEVLVDEGPPHGLARDPAGAIWLSVQPGEHEVLLSGPAPGQRQVQLSLPLRPHRVELQLSGWRVEGVRENGVPEAQLQLTRIEGSAQTAPIAPGPLPGFMRLTRTLRLGLDWRIESAMERLSPTGVPLSAAVPLVAGESVTSADLRVKDGRVLVSLASDQSMVRWDSLLDGRSELHLQASNSSDWVEVWRIDVSPIWHMQASGIPPVHHQDHEGRRLPEWRPWPGEVLTLTATRPPGIVGPSLTIRQSRLAIRIGERSSDARLTLETESSQGGQHTLRLPDEARLEEVRIDGHLQPIRQRGAEVTVPLHPGRQRFDLRWREPRGITSLLRSSAIDLGAPSVNHSLSMRLGNNRWLLLTGGPPLGPAVLFWGLIVVIALLAVGLGHTSLTPLKPWHWFLLGVGLSQAPVWGALTIVAWLLALGLRRRLPPDLAARRFDAVQLGLGILSIVALALLLDAIRQGLLGLPDMQVSGNDSTAYRLHWYQDRIPPEPPPAWIISVPLLNYRLLMLGWALWLAMALLGWLRWGWASLSLNGLWRPWRKTPAVPPAADSHA